MATCSLNQHHLCPGTSMHSRVIINRTQVLVSDLSKWVTFEPHAPL
jgi:hypothetical protein